jgi:hypothetical protein
MCAQAKVEPVFVEKDGQIDTVILSAQQFSKLQAGANLETAQQRQASFEKTHGAWIAEQSRRFEAHGLWCDDLRTW